MLAPFVAAGAPHVNVAVPFPETAANAVGASGNPAGDTFDDSATDAPTPTELAALIRKLYDVPFVSPVATYVVVRTLFATVIQPEPSFCSTT